MTIFPLSSNWYLVKFHWPGPKFSFASSYAFPNIPESLLWLPVKFPWTESYLFPPRDPETGTISLRKSAHIWVSNTCCQAPMARPHAVLSFIFLWIPWFILWLYLSGSWIPAISNFICQLLTCLIPPPVHKILSFSAQIQWSTPSAIYCQIISNRTSYEHYNWF